jgi:hypothetical protein
VRWLDHIRFLSFVKGPRWASMRPVTARGLGSGRARRAGVSPGLAGRAAAESRGHRAEVVRPCPEAPRCGVGLPSNRGHGAFNGKRPAHADPRRDTSPGHECRRDGWGATPANTGMRTLIGRRRVPGRRKPGLVSRRKSSNPVMTTFSRRGVSAVGDACHGCARGSSRLRINVMAEPPCGFRRTASSGIISPSAACSATLARRGSAGLALLSMFIGRQSSKRAPHTGQLTRQPSIQLRKRAPRVSGVASWRMTQRPQTCMGRSVAIRAAGRRRPRDCVIRRRAWESVRNVRAIWRWS